jgi:two-component system, chemotaxis family, protein-glutamate methylesterase/glutaminase
MSGNGAVPRVVICEDSRTYTRALARVLEHGGEVEVVGAFETAEATIAALPRLKPQLVTMDIELPGMSGLQAVERIMSAQPVPIVVLSSHVGPSSTATASALAAGALDALRKEDVDLRDPGGAAAAALRHRIKVLSVARVIKHPRGGLPPRRRSSSRTSRTAAAIGVVASTGGPQALAALLGAIPGSFPIPILLVQHMAAGFIEGFATWLDGAIDLPVRLGSHGTRAERGVWVAPEGAHLVLAAHGRLGLDRETVAGAHKPSGDVLLRSLAAVAGRNAVAVVLTGMGRDGAEGLADVATGGGITIAQDEATSAIFGMPRAAAERGVELVLPLARIAPTLSSLRRVPVQ